MKSIKLLLLLLVATSCSFAQDLIFAKQIQSAKINGGELEVVGSVISNDHFFVAGTFTDTILVDTVMKVPTGNSSFIAKYNPSGDLDKILTNSGTGYLSIQNIHTDHLGNIYVTAFTQGNVLFDTATISTNTGIFSYLIIKLDSNLQVIWRKTFYNNVAIGNIEIRIDNLTINKNDEVIVLGSAFENYNLDGIPLIGHHGKPFLAKLNPLNGLTQWVSQINGSYTCLPENLSITTDKNNDIILAGTFSSTVNSNQDYLVFNLTDTIKLVDYFTPETFMSKFQDNGSYVWANRIDTLYPNIPVHIAADTNNNMFIGANKLYKFDSNGILTWSKDISNGVIVDMVNNGMANYFVIQFSDSVAYDNMTIHSQGSKNVLVKTNPVSGTIEWHSKPYNLFRISSLYTSNKGLSAIAGTTHNTLLEKNLLYNNDKIIGFMTCFNDTSQFSANSNIVRGRVYSDTNTNCLFDSDITISGIGVMVSPGPYYAATDSLGNFEVKVNSGTYQVKPIKPIGRAIKMIPTCGISQNSIIFSGSSQIDSTSNFPHQYSECSKLKSYLTRSIMTINCIGNGETSILIKNLGLDTLFNVVANVKYPGNTISPLNSIPTWTSYSIIDSLVTFSIPFIAPGTFFQAVIADTIDCQNVTDSSQFAFNLKVAPMNTCYPEDTIYNYDSYTSTIVFPVSAPSIEKEAKQLVIYPNPTNSMLNILSIDQNLHQMSIVNCVGQRINLIKAQSNSTTHSIDCSNLADGIYTIQILDKNGKISNYKFIKQ